MWILIPTFLLATLLRQGVELLFGLLISGDVQVVGGLLEHTLKNEVGGGSEVGATIVMRRLINPPAIGGQSIDGGA